MNYFVLVVIGAAFCCCVSAGRNPSEKVNGHLIISSNYNPLAGIPNATTLSSGLVEKEFLDLMARGLNFTFEVRPPRDVLGLGAILNGTGTGGLGQLFRKEVDIYISGSTLTIDKAPYVDGSHPVLFDTIEIMTRYPSIKHKSNALVAIYSLAVWLCFLASTIAVALVLWIFIHSRGQQSESVFLLIFGLIASQGGYFRYKELSSRLTLGVWCLALVVLVNVYTSTLTSMLSAPEYDFVADSIEDVAKNAAIKPHMFVKSPTEEFIRNSPLATLQNIRNRLDKTASLLIPTNSDLAAVMSDRNDVMIASNVIIDAFVVGTTRKMGRCSYSIAKRPIHVRQLSYLFQKNSPLKNNVDRQIMLIHQAGLFERLIRQYVPDPAICSVTDKHSNGKLAKLTVTQLSDSFVLLATGLTASLISFLFSVFKRTIEQRTQLFTRRYM